MTTRESLSSPPGFHLPSLSDLADGIVSDEAEPTVIELTYYDTPDLRLARAGVTLLYRGDERDSCEVTPEVLRHGRAGWPGPGAGGAC